MLNREPYRRAQIIVADRNGAAARRAKARSMRLRVRHPLRDRAELRRHLHANNCLKNGLLPVVLSGGGRADIRGQLHEHTGATVTVDLAPQTVTDPAGKTHRFDIHPVRKKCLLEGLDDISLHSATGRSSRRSKRGIARQCLGSSAADPSILDAGNGAGTFDYGGRIGHHPPDDRLHLRARHRRDHELALRRRFQEARIPDHRHRTRCAENRDLAPPARRAAQTARGRSRARTT